MSSRTDLEGSATPVATVGVRARIVDALLPAGRARTGVTEVVGLLVVGTVVAFFRLGSASVHGTLWGEDGHVFLQDAYSKGSLHAVFVPYAGYLLLLPRMIAAVVVHLPLAWQGVAMSLGAAAVQSWVGTVSYVALSDHVRARWARLVVFAGCVAVPVGPEVIDSVANLQWFMLFAGCIVLFWSPSSRAGTVALHATLFAAITMSPFGLLPFGMAIIRWWLRRREAGGRASALVAITATAGFVVQTLGMVLAPPRSRDQAIHPALRPHALADGYLNRILGDGIFGVAQHRPPHLSGHGIWPGVFVLVVAAGVVIGLAIGPGRARVKLVFPAALAVLSLITFAVPFVLNAKTIAAVSNPFLGGRYYVTSVLFLVCCVAVLADQALSHRNWAALSRPWATQGLAAVAGVLLVGALIYGLATSWRATVSYGRETAQSWPRAVAIAKQSCAHAPRQSTYAIQNVPRGERWRLVLTCAAIRSH